MEKLNQLCECGSQVVRRIGGRNIIFFGLLGTAVAVKYTSIDFSFILDDSPKPYYKFKFFKRVVPTETVYEHPYW